MTIPMQWRDHCRPAPNYPSGSFEWHTERRKGVGASDISTILGFNQYSSVVDLWEDKTGRRAIDLTPPNPQALWGHRMEPFIRDDVADTLRRPIQTCGSVISNRWPCLRYSPDGYFLDDGALVEIKTTGVFQRDQWRGEQVADHAELQVQAGMAVTGASYAIVAVVIDRGDLELRRVERDDNTLIPLLVAEAEQFWTRVLRDEQPPIDGSKATTRLIEDRYPHHEGDVLADEAAAEWAEKYRAAAAEEAAAEMRKREAANNLRNILGSGKRLTSSQGKLIASLKGGRINEAKLTAEHPEIAAACTIARPVLDTDRLKADHPDIYRASQFTSINVPKGA